jgi:hypothetical protein
MENVVGKIKELLSSGNQLMVKDEQGNLHPLKAGKTGTIVEADGKDELYKLLWGKQRVGVNDIKELQSIVGQVKDYVVSNSSYASKKKLEKELK